LVVLTVCHHSARYLVRSVANEAHNETSFG
jgi:hypothetical protein